MQRFVMALMVYAKIVEISLKLEQILFVTQV